LTYALSSVAAESVVGGDVLIDHPVQITPVCGEVDTVSGGEKHGPSTLKENSGQRAGPVPRGTGTVVVPLVRIDNQATSNRPHERIQSGLVELLLRL